MKLLTTNFLTCAVKACKSSPLSFPLHFRDAVLERSEIEFNPLFVRNVLPRVDWGALQTTAAELGLGALVPEVNPVSSNINETDAELETEPADTDGNGDDEEALKKLHTLLLETSVKEGKLVCGNCGFEYPIKEGVGNFLLPAHLV